jgi:hypothetical protein
VFVTPVTGRNIVPQDHPVSGSSPAGVSTSRKLESLAGGGVCVMSSRQIVQGVQSIVEACRRDW